MRYGAGGGWEGSEEQAGRALGEDVGAGSLRRKWGGEEGAGYDRLGRGGGGSVCVYACARARAGWDGSRGRDHGDVAAGGGAGGVAGDVLLLVDGLEDGPVEAQPEL